MTGERACTKPHQAALLIRSLAKRSAFGVNHAMGTAEATSFRVEKLERKEENQFADRAISRTAILGRKPRDGTKGSGLVSGAITAGLRRRVAPGEVGQGLVGPPSEPCRG